MSTRSSNSRRSTASTASSTFRKPKWKQAGFLSAQPATSVSRIFAQPLQGSPLRSAIDQLPSIASSDDSISIISAGTMDRKRESASSLSELSGGHEAEDTLPEDALRLGIGVRSRTPSVASKSETVQEPQVEVEVVAEATVDELPCQETSAPTISTSNSTAPVIYSAASNTLEVAAQPSPIARSPPSRSTWFSSLSKSRARSPVYDSPRPDMSPASAAFDAALRETPNLSTQTQQIETLPSTECITSSISPPAPQSRPPSPRMNSDPNSVSSIDYVVPPPRTSPIAEPAVTRKASVSAMTPSTSAVAALNPSTSRFMLRIPLLGRPKTPLEEAIVHAGAERSPPAAQDGRSGRTESAVPQVIVSEPSADSLDEPAQSSSGDTLPSPEHAPEQEATAANTAEGSRLEDGRELVQSTSDSSVGSSSWWAYIGWSGSSSTTNVDDLSTNHASETKAEELVINTEVHEHSEQEPEATAPRADDVSTPTVNTNPTPAPLEPQSDLPAASVNVNEAQLPSPTSQDKQQTPSLLSAETSKSQGSAWYAPWSWYAASPITPSSSSLVDSKSQDHVAPSDEQQGHQKTESEMVKEEALAREEAQAQASEEAEANAAADDTTPQPTPNLSSPVTNPIESSISINKSGWASFFMSKALLTKTITYEQEPTKRDENGMEVMDIDDDEPAPQNQTATFLSTSAPSKAMTIVAGKPRGKPQPSPSPSMPSSPRTKDPAQPPPKEREPRKPGAPAPPLTNSESIKKETAKVGTSRPPSPAPSKGSRTPPRTSPPNLVLPTWNDTFRAPPRSIPPPPPPTPPTHKGTIGKTLDFVSGVLFSGKDASEGKKGHSKGKGKEREAVGNEFLEQFGIELPKALDVVGQALDPKTLDEKCRVIIIGVAGWSPGAVTRTIAGGLPSPSSKFVDMTATALEKFEEEHGFKFKKISKIALEGDGTIERKVTKIHSHLLANKEWLEDLHSADVIFVATHSQGSIVSAHLLDRLIREGHILTPRNVDIIATAASTVAPGGVPPLSVAVTRTQKICCLALCGIHLGPLRYLKTSSLLQPYIQYFENAAARELFDFQDTESEVSKSYVEALKTVMDHGAKMVYVASLNDQVVPIYSGLFTAAAHPRILRALYIDGDAYHSSDFLSNLLVLLIRIRNSGLPDSGLLAHLSEATAGTLSGVGHSTAYEELATYSLAVNYLFLATDGADVRKELVVEPFNAVNEQNDYEIPWSLRDLIADERVAHFFAMEFSQLKNAFDEWTPKTSILRDIKRKLQPIQRLSSIRGSSLGSRL